MSSCAVSPGLHQHLILATGSIKLHQLLHPTRLQGEVDLRLTLSRDVLHYLQIPSQAGGGAGVAQGIWDSLELTQVEECSACCRVLLHQLLDHSLHQVVQLLLAGSTLICCQ